MDEEGEVEKAPPVPFSSNLISDMRREGRRLGYHVPTYAFLVVTQKIDAIEAKLDRLIGLFDHPPEKARK